MRFAVVMPAFNESEGISVFVRELLEYFEDQSAQIHVVDDASSDQTLLVVERLTSEGLPVRIVRNEQNLGHGPSTLRALRCGLEAGASTIVAVDGDGQFLGEDVARVAMLAEQSGVDVVEGVRVGRNDPGYRRIVSLATRILVRRASGSAPRDANTPLRAYPRARLEELLSEMPEKAMTPNLLISASVRRKAWNVLETEVTSLRRRGASDVGTSWGGTRTQVPSRRFLSFCWRSLQQWRAHRRGPARNS